MAAALLRRHTVRREASMNRKDKPVMLPVVFSVTILAVMGVSSITPAFPVIKETLGLSSGRGGLLITVFTLPGVVLTPLYGVIIDRVSRRKVLIPVLLLYGIAGRLVPLGRDFRIMLLFRFFQRVGNAPLTTLSLTLISDGFEKERRNAVMGYNAAVLSIATAVFPAFGGALATISWQAPFYLPFLAVPVALLALLTVPPGPAASRTGVGEYLTKALTGLKNRYILTLYTGAFLVFCILFGAFLTYFTFFLSERFELRAASIGLTITAMSFSTALVSSNLDRLLKRSSFFSLIITAFLLYAISMVVLPLISRLPVVYIPVLLFGLARGLAIPLIQILISRYAPSEQRAVFLSFYSVVMNGGAALGPLPAGFFFLSAGMPDVSGWPADWPFLVFFCL